MVAIPDFMIISTSSLLTNKKHNFIIIISLLFVSLLCLFPSGAVHSSSAVENTSEYLSDVAVNHTVNGQYVAMMVEPNDNTNKKVNNPYTEFHYLYGVFREGHATYAGAVNADKSHSITIKEIDEDVSFSFLSVDSGFGVKEYYKDSSNETVYKHEYYPLELMFYSDHPLIPGQFSFLYISQSRANSLLDKQGLDHTKENYKKLQNSLITLSFDGDEYQFAIDNIYYERNYFYNALNETMGEFLFGGAKYPSGIKRQGLFFLRNYAYQNLYYIQHATMQYSLADFNFKILERNFKDGFLIDQNKLIYEGNSSYNYVSVLIVAFSITLLFGVVCLIYFGSYEFNYRNNLVFAGAALLPYFIFWIIHAITKSAILFSIFSITCEIWTLVGITIVYLILYLIKRAKSRVEVSL